MQRGLLNRLEKLLLMPRGRLSPEGNIVVNARIEYHWFLCNKSNFRLERMDIEFSQGSIVNRVNPDGRTNQPRHNVNQRSFPTSTFTNNGDGFILLYPKIN